jgi:ubiquinone/menaquinone biosynthesis C-methylase UbiE
VISWNKPCELEDFLDPDLVKVMRAVFPSLAASSARWPSGKEYRKHWEVGMSVLAANALLDDGQRQFALGIGAGTEATIFFLTNSFRWVFATDLYASKNWLQDSPTEMLSAPDQFARDTPFQKQRLVVQHMDARNLDYENETFDFIFSSSSIEHFGTREDIKRASREMGRVLKRRGIIAISTEYCVRGDPGYIQPDTLLAGFDDLRELIVLPTGCEPINALQLNISEATLRAPVPERDALRDRVKMQHDPDMSWSQYPHIVLDNGERAWTSYQLTLRKP